MPNPDRPRDIGGREPIAADQVAALPDRFGELAVLLEALLHVSCRHVLHQCLGRDQAQVFHRFLLNYGERLPSSWTFAMRAAIITPPHRVTGSRPERRQRTCARSVRSGECHLPGRRCPPHAVLEGWDPPGDAAPEQARAAAPPPVFCRAHRLSFLRALPHTFRGRTI